MSSQDDSSCVVFDLVTGQEKYGPATWHNCCRFIETAVYWGDVAKYGIWTES